MPPLTGSEAPATAAAATSSPLSALGVQCAAALAAAALLLAAAGIAGAAFSWPAFALAQGLFALRIALCLRAPRWWLALHAGLAPAAAALLCLGIAPHWYLAAFAVLVSIYWSTFRTRVPLYLSSARVPQALARLIPIDAGFEFVDLGCGLGGTLATLARLRPDGCFHGVEVAPLPFAVSALRALASGGQVQVRYGDFWKLDLAHYDVVYAFLSPVPMPRLWQKARAQMRPGTLLVSNSFEVPGVNPHATLRLDDRRGSALHVWRM